MTKCDICGEKIGFLSLKYSWVDKKDNLAVHDDCLKQWDIKFQNKMKTLEKLTQIDYTSLNENQKLEIQELSDTIIKDIDVDKDILYMRTRKPKELSREKQIKSLEDFIELVKKDDNFPNKEKTLKALNESLEFLEKKWFLFP